MASSALALYNGALQRRPLTVKIATSATLSGLAQLVGSCISGSKVDARGVLAYIIYGYSNPALAALVVQVISVLMFSSLRVCVCMHCIPATGVPSLGQLLTFSTATYVVNGRQHTTEARHNQRCLVLLLHSSWTALLGRRHPC